MSATLDPSFLSIPLAHRGLHDSAQNIPENALPAIRAACKAGYGIEIDVRVSIDGVAIVFHDRFLDRLTRTRGPLAALGAHQLTELTLKDSRGGAKISTLSQALEEISAGASCSPPLLPPLLIELKSPDNALAGTDGRLERAVVKALKDYQGPLGIMSFNPDCVKAMADLAPSIPRGLVSTAFTPDEWPSMDENLRQGLSELAHFETSKAQFVCYDWRYLGIPAIKVLQSKKIPVLGWAIRSLDEEKIARKIADNIVFEGYCPAHHQNL